MSEVDARKALQGDLLIGGSWRQANGPSIEVRDPSNPDRIVSLCQSATDADVHSVILAARSAFSVWSEASESSRFGLLREFAKIADARKSELATMIRLETGKPHWDALAESALIGAKVAATLDEGPLSRIAGRNIAISATREGRTLFRPHGVMSVIGPFNFPAHLPNGHIVPALAMGNTVVFKPSDKTPASGAMIAEWMREAAANTNAPTGVINVVQGGASVAKALVTHELIDGVLFTGSWAVGRKIIEANLDRPGRMLALEMGGNNAAIVMDDADVSYAAHECARSAFLSSGQRCTCTRRVIVHRTVANQFIEEFVRITGKIVVGDPATDVFMGPLISESARNDVLNAQREFIQAGAEVIAPCRAIEMSGWYITPGVLKVERFDVKDQGAGADIEVFGPLVRITIVDSFDQAIEQTNATRYGLAAAIFTSRDADIERFTRRAAAGCINVNCGTAGASSKLPFGGIGLSGNHRPAGAFSLDYCAYPVAAMVESGNQRIVHPGLAH